MVSKPSVAPFALSCATCLLPCGYVNYWVFVGTLALFGCPYAKPLFIHEARIQTGIRLQTFKE